MKLGRNLARTFLDYYKLQNIIVFNPVSTTLIPKLASSSTYLNLKSQSNTSPSPVQTGNSSGNLAGQNKKKPPPQNSNNSNIQTAKLFQPTSSSNEKNPKFFLENDLE